MKTKKTYTKPALNNWGTVTDLTKTGRTHCGGDNFSGSANSNSQGGGSPNSHCN